MQTQIEMTRDHIKRKVSENKSRNALNEHSKPEGKAKLTKYNGVVRKD